MKTEKESIEEVQMWTVAGLSLIRPVSINDVTWAVEEGFEAGKKFALEKNHEGDKNGI